MTNIGKRAFNALSFKLNTKQKNKVLINFAKLLKLNSTKIIRENQKDIANAKLKNLKENMIRRLELNKKSIEQIIKSVIEISNLSDPVNSTLSKWSRPNGLIIKKVSIPIGVIGIIYESRPNVTADVSCLCFKAGNSVILKGGSEAFYSNKIISSLFREALQKNKINKNYVQFLQIKNRKVVNFLLTGMRNYVDVIIPRGGKNLVKTVKKYSNIPVIGHLEGVCHTYIDKYAKLNMSKKIVNNAKMRNTSICGATETLLVHKQLSKEFLNSVLNSLQAKGCKIFADNEIRKTFKGKCFKSNKNIWGKEFLSNKIAVKSVKNISEAIRHVNKFGTMHTDAIITSNKNNASMFLKNVKSAIAIHNSSTQFADGSEFGFGGEVGISTNTLPPRGPVGLNQLVSYKYEVYGSGQIRK